MDQSCILCSSMDVELYIANLRSKNYFKCNNCFLIFVDTKFHLNFSEQKLRYDFHENSIDNPGYVSFLKKCINPTLPYIWKLGKNSDLQGLDFGSGPSPTLSEILSQNNLKVDNYDPIYFKEFPTKKYDFIFSTEVWEHFHEPLVEIQKIKNLLKPSAVVSVMTSTWNDGTDFETWYYPKDETHVCFYHEKTFSKIGEIFNFEILENPMDSIWIFQNVS